MINHSKATTLLNITYELNYPENQSKPRVKKVFASSTYIKDIRSIQFKSKTIKSSATYNTITMPSSHAKKFISSKVYKFTRHSFVRNYPVATYKCISQHQMIEMQKEYTCYTTMSTKIKVPSYTYFLTFWLWGHKGGWWLAKVDNLWRKLNVRQVKSFQDNKYV